MTYFQSSKQRALWLLGATIIAVMLLAAGFAHFELRPGEPFPYNLIFGESLPFSSTRVSGIPAAFIEILTLLGILAIILLLTLWLITFILRPKARKRMLQRIITYFILLLILAIFLEGFRQWAGKGEPPTDSPAETGQTEIGPPVEPLPTPPAFVANPPAWLTTLLALLLISIILGLLWFVWQRQQRRQVALAATETDSLTRLVNEARQTIDDVYQGGDLRSSILNCYRAMTQVLQTQRDIRRDQAMTARDFERHLAALGLRDEHIRRLTRLFEKFRYSPTEPSQADETEALDCLSAIVRVYGKAG